MPTTHPAMRTQVGGVATVAPSPGSACKANSKVETTSLATPTTGAPSTEPCLQSQETIEISVGLEARISPDPVEHENSRSRAKLERDL